jgi:transposase
MNDIILNESKQLYLDMNLAIPLNLTPKEQAILLLLQKLDYSEFFIEKKKEGRPLAVEPYTMMVIILYARIKQQYSSRDMEELCHRNLFLLRILDGRKAPDHCTIDRFLHTHSKTIEKLFYQVSGRLSDLGELGKKTAYQDGTKIESKAGKYSYVWKKTILKNQEKLEAHIRDLFAYIENQYQWDISDDNLLHNIEMYIDKLQGLQVPLIPEKKGRGHRLTQEQKLYKKLIQFKDKMLLYQSYLSQMTDRNSMSKTDKDATFMRMKEDHMGHSQLKPAYNLQLIVDSNYIVGAHASNKRTDYYTMIPLMNKINENLAWKYESYCADSGYDCQQNYEYLESRNIDAYIQPQNYRHSKKSSFKKEIGRQENMRYIPKEDCFICFRNKKLIKVYTRKSKSQTGYQTQANIYRCQWGCKTCKERARCMKRSRADYKQIQVNLRLKAYHKTAHALINSSQGKEIRVNRSIQAEGAFAQIKANWKFRRFLTSGMDNIYTEWILACLVVNTVHLAKRLESNLVGNPFHHKLKQSA